MVNPTEEWLRRIDDQLSERGVPVRRRPWDAWRVWANETGPSILTSPEAQSIFSWYTTSYPAGSFAVGSLFIGAFYFDEAVWPLRVPFCFGKVTFQINSMLEGVPEITQARLGRNRAALALFVAVAADCIDYGLGIDDIRSLGSVKPFAKELLLSADKELRSAVDAFLAVRPSQKSAEAARMATEMFLKGFLAQFADLDEKAARKRVGHDLDVALRLSLQCENGGELRGLSDELGVFPAVDERYDVRDWSLRELWKAYATAQFAATCVVRAITGRDIRPSLTARSAS